MPEEQNSPAGKKPAEAAPGKPLGVTAFQLTGLLSLSKKAVKPAGEPPAGPAQPPPSSFAAPAAPKAKPPAPKAAKREPAAEPGAAEKKKRPASKPTASLEGFQPLRQPAPKPAPPEEEEAFTPVPPRGFQPVDPAALAEEDAWEPPMDTRPAAPAPGGQYPLASAKLGSELAAARAWDEPAAEAEPPAFAVASGPRYSVEHTPPPSRTVADIIGDAADWEEDRATPPPPAPPAGAGARFEAAGDRFEAAAGDEVADGRFEAAEEIEVTGARFEAADARPGMAGAPAEAPWPGAEAPALQMPQVFPAAPEEAAPEAAKATPEPAPEPARAAAQSAPPPPGAARPAGPAAGTPPPREGGPEEDEADLWQDREDMQALRDVREREMAAQQQQVRQAAEQRALAFMQPPPAAPKPRPFWQAPGQRLVVAEADDAPVYVAHPNKKALESALASFGAGFMGELEKAEQRTMEAAAPAGAAEAPAPPPQPQEPLSISDFLAGITARPAPLAAPAASRPAARPRPRPLGKATPPAKGDPQPARWVPEPEPEPEPEPLPEAQPEAAAPPEPEEAAPAPGEKRYVPSWDEAEALFAAELGIKAAPARRAPTRPPQAPKPRPTPVAPPLAQGGEGEAKRAAPAAKTEDAYPKRAAPPPAVGDARPESIAPADRAGGNQPERTIAPLTLQEPAPVPPPAGAARPEATTGTSPAAATPYAVGGVPPVTAASSPATAAPPAAIAAPSSATGAPPAPAPAEPPTSAASAPLAAPPAEPRKFRIKRRD